MKDFTVTDYMTKAECIKTLIGYGIAPKDARFAVNELITLDWTHNYVMYNDNPIVIRRQPERRKKFRINFRN